MNTFRELERAVLNKETDRVICTRREIKYIDFDTLHNYINSGEKLNKNVISSLVETIYKKYKTRDKESYKLARYKTFKLNSSANNEKPNSKEIREHNKVIYDYMNTEEYSNKIKEQLLKDFEIEERVIDSLFDIKIDENTCSKFVDSLKGIVKTYKKRNNTKGINCYIPNFESTKYPDKPYNYNDYINNKEFNTDNIDEDYLKKFVEYYININKSSIASGKTFDVTVESYDFKIEHTDGTTVYLTIGNDELIQYAGTDRIKALNIEGLYVDKLNTDINGYSRHSVMEDTIIEDIEDLGNKRYRIKDSKIIKTEVPAKEVWITPGLLNNLSLNDYDIKFELRKENADLRNEKNLDFCGDITLKLDKDSNLGIIYINADEVYLGNSLRILTTLELVDGPVGKFDENNGMAMPNNRTLGVFENLQCRSIELSKLNTIDTYSMDGLFSNTMIDNLKLDFKGKPYCIDISYMFESANIKNLDTLWLGNINIIKACNSFSYSNIKHVDNLGLINLDKVTNIKGMFSYCSIEDGKDIHIDNKEFKRLLNMDEVFNNSKLGFGVHINNCKFSMLRGLRNFIVESRISGDIDFHNCEFSKLKTIEKLVYRSYIGGDISLRGTKLYNSNTSIEADGLIVGNCSNGDIDIRGLEIGSTDCFADIYILVTDTISNKDSNKIILDNGIKIYNDEKVVDLVRAYGDKKHKNEEDGLWGFAYSCLDRDLQVHNSRYIQVWNILDDTFNTVECSDIIYTVKLMTKNNETVIKCKPKL